MEGSTVGGLRSRSRSKTPFLRSSCDHENCTETEDHTHAKSGRHTPVKRSTPVKQLQQTKTTTTVETITEEVDVSPPVTRSRQSARIAGDHLAKTSDYSSEESLDRLKGHKKEIFQNEVNSQYERVTTTTTSRHGTLADLTLSPIHAGNVTNDRSTRFGSPAYSACSSDSSFAEQALADASSLLDRDPRAEHLPSRLYKMAGEYWNKYPKTDYTYSPLSKDRVELAPGQIAVPNMSRRSLSQFRVQGPATSVDEVDRLAATAAWTANTLRKRYTTIDSSDDECYARNGFPPAQQRWWLTRVLITIVTSITSTVGGAYRRVVGPAHRYPYTERRPAQTGILSRTASVAAAPFYWIYTMIKTVVTTTVTTVTETFSPSESSVRSKHASRNYQQASKRRWWPWLLLLLLPLLGYGSYYTYENADRFAMPNFTDFQLDLSEYSAAIPSISLPNITLPTLDLSLPDINITLPAITENLPEVSKTYVEYRDIVHNRVSDASDYVKVVAESCFEELRRFWRGHHYQEYILPQAPVTDTYKPPQIVQDPDLSKRVAALEDWAINVDSRIKFFDQKLSKFDNLEEQIEQYSVRYLQQNLIQIFNAQDSDAVAAKLKSYFDEHYISKEQMLVMSQEIHERLIASWQPELDEDKIRGIVQGYLSVFEKKQMEVLVARFKEYVKEVEVTRKTGAPDMEAVRRLVAGMLDVYDADKTGLVDYALESAGGQVVSTKCTELYQIKTKQYSILGLPVWWVYTSPRFALTPGAMPAECWAFQGFPGYLVIRTYAVVEVTGFSLEHMSRLLAVDGKIESAPKNFSVYGLHGESDPEPHLFGDYTYDANGTAIQHFPVQHPKTTDIGGVAYPVAYDIVELRVESNHGNPTYTCVYRFRVHGNPLTDIRRATEDSIRDSET